MVLSYFYCRGVISSNIPHQLQFLQNNPPNYMIPATIPSLLSIHSTPPPSSHKQPIAPASLKRLGSSQKSWDSESTIESSQGDIPLDSGVAAWGLPGEQPWRNEPTLTDRYIPSRKSLPTQLTPPPDPSTVKDENTPPGPPDQNHQTPSDIFHKCIMECPKNSIKLDTPISHYHNKNLFQYQSSIPSSAQGSQLLGRVPFSDRIPELDFTQELVSSIKAKRKINKMPFKVLDAPALQDDFYLNLIDWGQQNFLAVGLASNVYLWNGNNSKVSKLCDLGMADSVTSVGWATKGLTFSLGTNSGEVQLWDINKMKRVRVMHGHSNRVSSLAWSSSLLTSGSRDKTILHRDIRCHAPYLTKLQAHKQEVCGLRWSPDEQMLCSGGNDNKLMVWSSKSVNPLFKFSDHTAAVKAVAWSPHQHGLLASGGGTADRHIRFRNALTGQTIKAIDTGSQVCNLMFGRTLNEVVSTHGYSYNEINIWKYPKMEKTCTLMGHTMRVLYLTMSPDGSTIVTGAGDQTLRFWNVFPSSNNRPCIPTQLTMGSVMLR